MSSDSIDKSGFYVTVLFARPDGQRYHTDDTWVLTPGEFDTMGVWNADTQTS